MKISGISKIYETYSAKSAVVGKKTKSEAKKDNVNVSNKAREFQLAFKSVSSMPNIREDKIEYLKEQMDNGTYNVSAENIADKILSNL